MTTSGERIHDDFFMIAVFAYHRRRRRRTLLPAIDREKNHGKDNVFFHIGFSISLLNRSACDLLELHQLLAEDSHPGHAEINRVTNWLIF